MARPRIPEIRKKLRDQAINYVLSNGLQELSLRPLAKALKTNARMLIYHFGSREGLMREILAGLREREDVRIRSWFGATRHARTLPEFLRWYWQELSDSKARPAVRLLFELYALALRKPNEYPGVLEDPLGYWKKLAAKGAGDSRIAEEEATLLLAATRGLLLDLCATGDRARVGRAMELLAGLIEPGSTKGN